MAGHPFAPAHGTSWRQKRIQYPIVDTGRPAQTFFKGTHPPSLRRSPESIVNAPIVNASIVNAYPNRTVPSRSISRTRSISQDK